MTSSFRTRLSELEKKADDLSGEAQDLSSEISNFKDEFNEALEAIESLETTLGDILASLRR